MSEKKYVCLDCGEKFEWSRLEQVLGPLMRPWVLSDPAPSPLWGLLAKCRCPKCRSERVRKIYKCG